MGKDSNNKYKDFIQSHASEKKSFFKDYILIWVILFSGIIFTIVNPAFLSVDNMYTIIKQASIVGLLALGLNIIVIIGGFDISIGAIATLGAVVMIAQLMNCFEFGKRIIYSIYRCTCFYSYIRDAVFGNRSFQGSN